MNALILAQRLLNSCRLPLKLESQHNGIETRHHAKKQ
jgi:hypothetical protein